jgi:hypothetical protein
LCATRFHPDRQAIVALLVDTFTVIGARPDSSLDQVLHAAVGLAAAYMLSPKSGCASMIAAWERLTSRPRRIVH